MKRGSAAPMVLSVLLGSSSARFHGHPHNFQSSSISWSEDLKAGFVDSPETLQWAVGNGTEVIVIEQHLDLRIPPVDVNLLSLGILNVLDTKAIQGLQINPAPTLGAPERLENLLLSNLRIRESSCGTRATGMPGMGHSGLLAVASEQLWLQNVFLEGSASLPGSRGLDVRDGVAVYMEGGGVTGMVNSGQGPAFRLGAGSSAHFSQVTFANMQLNGAVALEGLTGSTVTQEGRYGLLGKQAGASSVAFDNCRLRNVTVNVMLQEPALGATVDSGASMTIDGTPAVSYGVSRLDQKLSQSSASQRPLIKAKDSWFMGMLQRLEDAKVAHEITEPSRGLLEANTDSISSTVDDTTDSGLGIVPPPPLDSATIDPVEPVDLQATRSNGSSSDSNVGNTILIAVVAVGSLILVALVVLLCCLARRQRQRAINRKKRQADLVKADGGTAATCGTSAELENRMKNLSDLQRWSPHNTIEGSNAASCHSHGAATQGPYLPVPWLHSGSQTGQPPLTHSPSDLTAHPPLGSAPGSVNGVRQPGLLDDPYHVPNGANFESGRTDVHRDVNDPEYIEHGTVEPQLCDFPPFPPAHLPDIDPKMEEAQAAQASQHLPAPSSSEPSIMGTPQPGTNPHLHPGKTGHAQVGSHPNPAAAWNNLQPYKGDGSSFDATSSQREVNSKQPLLPQKQPSGTSIASVQEQNHGGPSPTLPMPVIPKPKAQPPPTASAAPQQGAPTPPPQASDAQQDGEAKPQWQAGQEGDVVPAPASHGQAQGEGGLIEALNQYAANGALLFERYVVRGAQDRRFGGQGVVQFAQDPHTQEQYAIKFFTKRQGFERERKLYDKLALRSMMPAVIEVVPNADNRYATEDGFVFPPCLVVERGESLDEWARRIEPGFLTILSVLCDVATRLQQLHHAGYVHRDVKPGNVLWRPTQFSWTLIDFGCAAAIGTQCGLSFSLLYAPPEVIQSVESQAKGMRADPKTDMWAMGVIAYELLTRTRIFPASLTRAEVRDRIAGRVPLPWEEPEAKASGHRQLRILKHTVLACLNRDPSARPTAAKLLRSWNRIFDTFSAGSGGVGTTTNVLAGRQPPQA